MPVGFFLEFQMAWIESHSTLRTHKKLKPLCELLGVSRAAAIGHLHMLWWWALDNRENGDLSGLFHKDIADACDWNGKPDKLIKALKKTGWLTKNMQINDWSKIGLASVKRRHAACNERSKYRARLKKATIEKVNRQVIILRDKSTCYLCLSPLKSKEVTLDHVIPLARGGVHAETNLRVACRPCNSRKWAR